MAELQTKTASAEVGARSLLQAERYGFAIDATTYDTDTAAAYVGGPVGGTLAIHADNVTDKPNIPMDAAAGLLKGTSPLVQSGTSPKMVHFPTSPYVRWSPHNNCTLSQTFGSWAVSNTSVTSDTTAAPDGTTTADTITISSSGNFRQVRLDDVVASSTWVWTASVYFKRGNNDWALLYLGDSGGNDVQAYFNLGTGLAGTLHDSGDATAIGSTMTSVGSGWYRCTVTASWATTRNLDFIVVPTDDDSSITWASTSTDTLIVWGAQLVRGYNANPYLVTTSAARIGIPQSYDTAATQYGILVEPAATNLCLRSEELDNAEWADFSATITPTANATTAPDGSATADLLNDDNAGDAEYRAQQFPMSNGAAYAISVFIKAGTSNIGYLATGDGSTDYAVFIDLTTGATQIRTGVGTPTNITTLDVGGGWWRLSYTITAGNTAGYIIIAPAVRSNLSAGTIDISATGTAYFWGAQVETGTVATSYIPTLGSTVTRAADDIAIAVSTFPYSSTASTFYVDTKPLRNNYTNAAAFIAGENTTDLIGIYYSLGTSIGAWVESSGPQWDGTTWGALVKDTRMQLTMAVAANDGDASKDGGALMTEATITMPSPAATEIAIARHPGTGNIGNAFHYRFVYVPRQVETDDGDLENWRYNF
jgi:hypothetical protein